MFGADPAETFWNVRISRGHYFTLKILVESSKIMMIRHWRRLKIVKLNLIKWTDIYGFWIWETVRISSYGTYFEQNPGVNRFWKEKITEGKNKPLPRCYQRSTGVMFNRLGKSSGLPPPPTEQNYVRILHFPDAFYGQNAEFRREYIRPRFMIKF